MKKILILTLLILTISLSCCGIYKLGNFVMPDDMEFLEVVESNNTPEKICEYMKENFVYEYHHSYAPNPYILWKTKKGDCNDFAWFGRFIANYHDYETYWIQIFFTTGYTGHVIGIYVEDGKYNYSTNRTYCFVQADSFEDCVLDYFFNYSEKELQKYDVYNYEDKLWLLLK